MKIKPRQFYSFASKVESNLTVICFVEFIGCTMNICFLEYYFITVYHGKPHAVKIKFSSNACSRNGPAEIP